MTESNIWGQSAAAVLVVVAVVFTLLRHPWFVLLKAQRAELWTDWLTRSFRQAIPHRLLAAARSDPAAWAQISPLLADQLEGYQRALESARHDWRLGRYRERVLASLQAHIADLHRMQQEIEGGRPVKSA